jgi:S-DNA-T family DNA segregation ATPase FtsK/SpoIIIE
MENVLLVGGDHAARYGMLSCMLASLSCMATAAVVRVVDFSSPGTPWNGLLATAVNDLLVPSGYDARFGENGAALTDAIDELADEMNRRIALSEAEKHALPAACLFLADADRFHDLRKKPGKYGGLEISSEIGKKLRLLCSDGPAMGIHVVLGCSTFSSVLQIADRQQIENFRHRIALQMSEEDAFTFVRSRTASRLQAGGAVPILALYGDIVAGREVRFKPYSINSAVSAAEIMQHIRSRITRWETQL